MIAIRLSHEAQRRGLKSFWRCGVQHTVEGAEFAPGTFTAREWDVLKGDPMLEVGGGTAASQDQLLKAAIASLAVPDDFTASGKPEVAALRKAAAEHGLQIEITADVRDAIWERLGG